MKSKKHTLIFTISCYRYWTTDRLTDGLGRKVDFKNSLIIMTSNIGARQLKDFGDGVGFATMAKTANADENNKAVIEKSAQTHIQS